MQHLRLTRPDLDFFVDITVHEREGRSMATADLAGTRGMSESATCRGRR